MTYLTPSGIKAEYYFDSPFIRIIINERALAEASRMPNDISQLLPEDFQIKSGIETKIHHFTKNGQRFVEYTIPVYKRKS